MYHIITELVTNVEIIRYNFVPIYGSHDFSAFSDPRIHVGRMKLVDY